MVGNYIVSIHYHNKGCGKSQYNAVMSQNILFKLGEIRDNIEKIRYEIKY